MSKVKTTLILVIVVLVAVFAVQNVATVEIQFLIWSLSLPRAVLVVILLAAGFLLGVIAASMSSSKERLHGAKDGG